VNWAYIAGFFDGEGSLYKNGTKCPDGAISYTINIPQAQSRKIILEKIKDFIEERGVKCAIHARYRGIPRTPNHEIMWNLRVSARESVKIVIEGMLPYLVAKKLFAQDVWRFYRIYPTLRGRARFIGNVAKKLDGPKVREIRSRLASGERVGDVAKQFGVTHTTICGIKDERLYGWIQ